MVVMPFQRTPPKAFFMSLRLKDRFLPNFLLQTLFVNKPCLLTFYIHLKHHDEVFFRDPKDVWEVSSHIPVGPKFLPQRIINRNSIQSHLQAQLIKAQASKQANQLSSVLTANEATAALGLQNLRPVKRSTCRQRAWIVKFISGHHLVLNLLGKMYWINFDKSLLVSVASANLET